MSSVQLSLLGHEEPDCDADFKRVRHTALDASSFVDYLPGFVHGDAALFEHLQRTINWQQHERVMYDRIVAVPRLTASVPRDGAGHPVLAKAAGLLSARYDVELDSITLAFYRDGNDSVAWHRDRMKNRENSVVAIVSLGDPRRFMLRPFGGGEASMVQGFGRGDLLVMGGGCQAHWEHKIPKTKRAYPRLSVMFRHRAAMQDG